MISRRPKPAGGFGLHIDLGKIDSGGAQMREEGLFLDALPSFGK
jgi:hypothetical protein